MPSQGHRFREETAMCHLFASQAPATYAFETRSIRLNGQSTSLRLEKVFWGILEQLARREGFTVPRFISTLHSEILILRGEAPNFTSHLRCICLVALENGLVGQDFAPQQAA
jgi:predicted DNA-binding ribbon-helix-helix protein